MNTINNYELGLSTYLLRLSVKILTCELIDQPLVKNTFHAMYTYVVVHNLVKLIVCVSVRVVTVQRKLTASIGF